MQCAPKLVLDKYALRFKTRNVNVSKFNVLEFKSGQSHSSCEPDISTINININTLISIQHLPSWLGWPCITNTMDYFFSWANAIFSDIASNCKTENQKSLNQVRISYSSQSSILIHKIPPNEEKNVHPVQQLQCKLMLLINEKYFHFSNYQLSQNDINRVENPIVYNVDWTVSCVIRIYISHNENEIPPYIHRLHVS